MALIAVALAILAGNTTVAINGAVPAAASPAPRPPPATRPMPSADGGWRMPAEWEPHAATWIAWPHELKDRVNLEEFLQMCTAAFPEPRTFSKRVAAVLKGRLDDFDTGLDRAEIGLF